MGSGGISAAPRVSEVTLQKKEVPGIDFVSPPFGKFLGARETVEVVPSREGAYRSLELFVDENLLQSFDSPPFVTAWNTEDLPPGTHLLVARAKSGEGVAVSDWVLVGTGEGGLRVRADLRDSSASVPERVVFIIDASISQLDVWGSKSKWEWEKEALLDSKVMGKLARAKVAGIRV